MQANKILGIIALMTLTGCEQAEIVSSSEPEAEFLDRANDTQDGLTLDIETEGSDVNFNFKYNSSDNQAREYDSVESINDMELIADEVCRIYEEHEVSVDITVNLYDYNGNILQFMFEIQLK